VRERPLLETDVDPDPHRQFEHWFADAAAAGIRAPEAVALATASADGAPSVRMVLVKGFDEGRFVFYTSYASRKGRELADNPRAALLFSWDVLGRQARIEGPVARLEPAESEAYFRTRPRGSQIGAWAAVQSEPIASRVELEAAAARIAARFEGRDVPLPPAWGGYRLTAESYELWQHRDDRLHDRLRYLPDGAGAWTLERLGP
jgi:pyridoxamine 5'-phosphate oxidase